MLAPPTGGGGGDQNGALLKLAEEIILGQLGSSDPQQAAQQKAGLAQKCEQLTARGFQPNPTTRAIVGAALGSDPFGG